jgi:hypothetical protein
MTEGQFITLKMLIWSTMTNDLGEHEREAVELVRRFMDDMTITPERVVDVIGNFDVWKRHDREFVHAALLMFRMTGIILKDKWRI